MLSLYNSLTRQKESFCPIVPGEVRMYVCGMTVYDVCHVGHARVMVVFDMVARWLRMSGMKVTYVRNITDLDDKIIKRATENGESIGELTGRFIAAMNEDAEALGVIRPDHEPKATEYVAQMLDMMRTLEGRGLAYAAPNGDVYYRVRGFPGYGKLSGKGPDDLRAGERVQVGEAKEDPLDFVLWKAAKPGEPSWPSPWGPGRPGWHIECSAMSGSLLGRQFDIHGGGQDLQFPHHENEIAQSEGAHQCTFVNYWMHNGFVRVDDEKMSKSLGNFFTVREVLAKYAPEVVRFFILRAHYRSPLNYSDAHLDDARRALDSLYITLRDAPPAQVGIDWAAPRAARFAAAMNDDFNTPEALAVLFELSTEANREKGADPGKAAQASGLLHALGAVLGLLQAEPSAYLRGPSTGDGLSDNEIDVLVAERRAARAAKDFARSDAIRDQLAEAGITLEDTPQGTLWRR
jgi:cysteinyl-tRNA synthetase